MKCKSIIILVVVMVLFSSFAIALEFGYDNREIPTLRQDMYCSIYGCTFYGDLDLDNNSIINANYINVTYINLTTIYGDIYGDIFGDWNGSSNYYTIAQIDQNFTDFATGISTYDDTWINTTTNASILYMIQNLTTNGTNAEYDGGFANSVYLASQLMDGGGA